MKTENIKKLLKTTEYDFLRTNEHLGENTILLTLGGSHAYGTSKETSDVDIRGIAANSKKDNLLMQDFEQVIDNPTDTTIYSLHKMLGLLANNNPNTIEILGCKPEHYFHKSIIGQSLLDNADMFLSKRAINTFGKYAESQLRRLENKTLLELEEKRRQEHIKKTIEKAWYAIEERYAEFSKTDHINIEVFATPNNEERDHDLFITTVLSKYPLRDCRAILSEIDAIVRSFDKLGDRNAKAMAKDKIGKHSMHLLRLYMMCIDLLEKHEIITYREDEHDLLMSIRNDEFLDEKGIPTKEFYKIVDEYERRLEIAAARTTLPDRPDFERIEKWKIWANNKIICGEAF